MLDLYRAIIDGCRARSIAMLVTYNHYTTPIWFAKQGGWLHADAPTLFARFCGHATRHLGAGIRHAMTLNEPNILHILRFVLPEPVFAIQHAMLDSAAKSLGVRKFIAGYAVDASDVDAMTVNLIAGHKAARSAIKAVRPDLPVRARLIPAALAALRGVMAEGVPVRGYCHWSLLDNYEWISGYKQQLGLVAVDRTTFMRTPKPSAYVYGAIARRNAL